MSVPDAFALQRSGLNQFLLAEVGTEENGSPLTVLSVLARLGRDPWTEAAKWTKLPKASMIDCLADSIRQMPLRPQALADARITAARLILLLPAQVSHMEAGVAGEKTTVPAWLPLAAVIVALALGIAFEMAPPATPAVERSINPSTGPSK